MNSRRNFLLQGSMATTALMVSKPFESVARALAPVTGFSVNNNRVVFVHTGDQLENTALKDIASLKKSTGNLAVFHAGKNSPDPSSLKNFDAAIGPVSCQSPFRADAYKIIYKGKIRIGVISAHVEESDLVNRVNELAAWLKNEKNCHIVACLSGLGFKSPVDMDDRKLAENSTHLDLIIGGHAKNYCLRPFVIRNRNKEEVVINHAAEHGLSLRRIEWEFDNQGNKMGLAINRTIPLTNQA